MAEIGCLKDGHFNNLEVANTVVMKKNCTNITHSASLTKSHCGIVFLNGSSTSVGGIGTSNVDITLPTTETGLHYKFILNASMAQSSASFVISTQGNASLVGTIDFAADAANPSANPTDKKIIFGKNTAPGDFVDLNCYDDDHISRWHVFGVTKYEQNATDGLRFG